MALVALPESTTFEDAIRNAIFALNLFDSLFGPIVGSFPGPLRSLLQKLIEAIIAAVSPVPFELLATPNGTLVRLTEAALNAAIAAELGESHAYLASQHSPDDLFAK